MANNFENWAKYNGLDIECYFDDNGRKCYYDKVTDLAFRAWVCSYLLTIGSVNNDLGTN